MRKDLPQELNMFQHVPHDEIVALLHSMASYKDIADIISEKYRISVRGLDVAKYGIFVEFGIEPPKCPLCGHPMRSPFKGK